MTYIIYRLICTRNRYLDKLLFRQSKTIMAIEYVPGVVVQNEVY